MQSDPVNSELRATLDTVQELIAPLTDIDATVKQSIMKELERARDQLQVLNEGSVGSFSLPSRSESTFSQSVQHVEKCQLVDSLSRTEQKRVDSDVSPKAAVEFYQDRIYCQGSTIWVSG